MAAILHQLDQRRLIDSNGIADGSSIYFYTTNTLTPAPVYTTAALDVEHSSPIVVASGAAVPNIYLDSAITYRRRIVYGDGSVDDTDPWEGGIVRGSDLASTDAGKGEDLVATTDGGTLGDARTTPTPEMKGAVVGQDTASAMQALCNIFGEAEAVTDLNGIGTVALKPGRTYLLGESVVVPLGVNIESNGAFIEPHPDASLSDFTDGFAFLHNRSKAGAQIIAGGGWPLPTWAGLRFNNVDQGGDIILAGWRGIDTKGHIGLNGVQAHGMSQLLSKTSSGSSDNNYVDNIRLQNIYFRRSQGTDWMIDVPTNGDNFLAEGIASALSNTNHNILHMQFCLGGRLSRIINSNILLDRVQAVTVENLHMEKGYIEARNSDWSLRNSFFIHDPDTQGAVNPETEEALGFAAPIRHLRRVGGAAPGMLQLENVVIAYEEGRFPSSYASDTADLLLEAQANAEIANFYRFPLTSNFAGSRSAAKIARYAAGTSDGGAPPAMWENVSHLAAKRSYFSANRLTVQNSEVDIPTSYAAFSGAVSSAINGKFQEESSTYYYRVVILHGPKDRLIARTTAEFSVSATQGGNAVFIGGANTNAATRPGFTNTVMRIYRGTAAGSYDKVVDVPVMNGLTVVDRGFALAAGEVWKDRSSGDIDSFNTSSTFSRVVVRDEKNCTLYGTTVLPTVGAWVARDRFIGTAFEAVYDGSAWAPVAGPVETSISATPAYVGQQAVVGGVAYVAVDTSSSADWKAVTA